MTFLSSDMVTMELKPDVKRQTNLRTSLTELLLCKTNVQWVFTADQKILERKH